MRYKVHRFDMSVARGPEALEEFLNGLEGDVVAILPDIVGESLIPAPASFILVIERIDEAWRPWRDKGERIPEDIAVP